MSAGGDVESLFERAMDLHARGRDEEAKAAYLDVLRHDDTHAGTLNNLGTLLFNTGFRTAARRAYAQAVAHHPAHLTSRVNLANALYENEQLAEALDQYEGALRIDDDCAAAHQGIAYVLERLGDPRAASLHRERGYRGHAIVALPYRGSGEPIAVMLLLSALGGNVNTDRFLDDRVFAVTKAFADYYEPSWELPPHHFVFNGIGDAELCARALAGATQLLARTAAPVMNPPAFVERTARAANAARLRGLAGVVAPATHDFSRELLFSAEAVHALAERGLHFPLLLRTPGHHTGEHFLRIERPDALADAVAQLPGERLTAIEFVDVRDTGGNVRKYRVMTIDGVLYPLHLAIASQWKVHYFTAAMHERPEHRAEEAAFLGDMLAVLGEAAVAALERIAAAVALDYAGIDFALDRDGNVVVFEANATMMVPPLDPDPRFAYRRPATQRIFNAVRTMLLSRARGIA